MSELEDLWHDQEQYTPRGVARRAQQVETLQTKIEKLEEQEKWLRASLKEADARKVELSERIMELVKKNKRLESALRAAVRAQLRGKQIE